MADSDAMKNTEWRTRLAEEIDRKGMKMRSVSLRAKLGPGYVHSILSAGKDPTIENLLRVCDVLGVSPIYILMGHDVTPEDEAIVSSLHESREVREAVLTLLKQRTTI
jgi:transcriptional regulator with XRE-family HTH domain